MEQKNTQQEILLPIKSSFANRQWAETDSKDSNQLSSKEKLEKACWDGLVKEIIPELDITLQTEKKLWLWKVNETQSFLALEYYEFPGPGSTEGSINPYIFLSALLNN